MQVGVHGLTFVLVFIAKTHIGNLSPLAGKSLAIAILHRVEAMLFDILKQADGIFQSLSITRGTMIFAQPVDGKADGIDLLLRIQWVAFAIERPVDTAELAVIEMIYHIAFGTRCRRQVFFLLQQTVGCRESPENTGIQYSTLFCFRHQDSGSRDAAIEATVRFIRHPVHPEGKNVGCQLFFHLFSHILDVHKKSY